MADVNHLDGMKQNACFYASRADAVSSEGQHHPAAERVRQEEAGKKVARK